MNREDDEPEFELLEELGRGGMSIVNLAAQLPLGREVAIKRAARAEDLDSSFLIMREALIMGQLEHPNIPPVHALIDLDEGPAVVMKRLSGTSWEALIDRGDAPLDRHLEVATQVAHALAFAHSRGVVHRDVKPSNVMIGDFGEVYLLDWGCARRKTDPWTDIIVGTPRYMAPEMAEGLADERTDVFLLGATLHCALTGEPRHRDGTALEVLYAAMNVEPYVYPESVPDELAELCNRACAADPSARFASVLEMRTAIATLREHRAASLLSDDAERELDALREAIVDPQQGNASIQERFTRTRFGFEAALRTWPASPSAQRGLEATLHAMIDYELHCRRPEAALALLEVLRTPDEARRARAHALEAELRDEKQRAQAMERDRDPRVGAPDRARAYRALAIVTLALTLTSLAQRLLFPDFRPSPLRLAVVGGLLFVIVGGIVAWWRRRGDWNFINQRIAEVALSTLLVSFASRLSGFLLHAPTEHVLATDAFIVGLGGAVMSPYHRAGPWLALLSFAVAVIGSIWPHIIYSLFVGLSVLLPIVFLLSPRQTPQQTR